MCRDDWLYFDCGGCGIVDVYGIKGEREGGMWMWKKNVIEGRLRGRVVVNGSDGG